MRLAYVGLTPARYVLAEDQDRTDWLRWAVLETNPEWLAAKVAVVEGRHCVGLSRWEARQVIGMLSASS